MGQLLVPSRNFLVRSSGISALDSVFRQKSVLLAKVGTTMESEMREEQENRFLLRNQNMFMFGRGKNEEIMKIRDQTLINYYVVVPSALRTNLQTAESLEIIFSSFPHICREVKPVFVFVFVHNFVFVQVQ